VYAERRRGQGKWREGEGGMERRGVFFIGGRW
jgi:hypothetical protein